MTHSYGYRRQTRKKFKRNFRQHGSIRMTNYLTTYKVGDYVDIKVDGSQHKGMPFKLYHGRTGTVYNVNPRGIGVKVLKKHNERYIEKRLNLRVEHIKKSNVRELFAKRVQENDKLKQEANKKGIRISTKRQPTLPRAAHTFKPSKVEFQQPKVFREVF